MAALTVGLRVLVVGGAPWAVGASGTITTILETSCLVTFDVPRDDGSGDGPYVAAAFAQMDLTPLES